MRIVRPLLLFALATPILLSSPVYAHVIVTPKQVGIASTQEFSMSVPTEKDTPTIAIRLLIPNGVENVIPNAKPGWTITEHKNNDQVTEMDWADGSIPVNERDTFLFEAQAPPQPTTLKWKAYQTYQDGSVVSWINTPTTNPEDDSAPPPYSTTLVVNDLSSSSHSTTDKSTDVAESVSVVALVVSLIASTIGWRALKKSKH